MVTKKWNLILSAILSCSSISYAQVKMPSMQTVKQYSKDKIALYKKCIARKCNEAEKVMVRSDLKKVGITAGALLLAAAAAIGIKRYSQRGSQEQMPAEREEPRPAEQEEHIPSEKEKEASRTKLMNKFEERKQTLAEIKSSLLNLLDEMLLAAKRYPQERTHINEFTKEFDPLWREVVRVNNRMSVRFPTLYSLNAIKEMIKDESKVEEKYLDFNSRWSNFYLGLTKPAPKGEPKGEQERPREHPRMPLLVDSGFYVTDAQKQKIDHLQDKAGNYFTWFQLLNVPVNAARKNIESAARRLLAKYHPDKWKGAENKEIVQEIFKIINNAKDRGLIGAKD